MKTTILNMIVTAMFTIASVEGAVTFITHAPSLPVGALTNPYASISLDGNDAWISVTSIDSLPSSLSLVEVLGDGSSQHIFSITSTPVVQVYAPQLGFPGGMHASYTASFSFSADEIAALGSGFVALAATFSDGSMTTHRFERQVIPEVSASSLVCIGIMVVALQRRRQRTRRATATATSRLVVNITRIMNPKSRHNVRPR